MTPTGERVLACEPIGAPFVHGFSTRVGGVSEGRFRGLNLGARWGDAAANVDENRWRLLQLLKVPAPLYVARQVHGIRVVRVRAGDDPGATANLEADALLTGDAGVTLGVHVADCSPALFFDARTGAVAAAHAGWRGTVAGVLPAVVRALGDEFGTRPQDLRVALGPAIGRCCFEVGADVVASLDRALGGALDGVVERSPRGVEGKWHASLNAANAILLERAGVPPDAIHALPECTSCDPGSFYSYRRDGGPTGQQMGIVARRST
jgi:YfiH family protein